MVGTRKCVFIVYQNPLRFLLCRSFSFSETWLNKHAGGIPYWQQQVRELTHAHVCVFLRTRTDTTIDGNPRAADAPACQINSHRSPCAATNVNLRKGESVRSLSAAIFTHVAHAHVQPHIGKVRGKKKFAGEFESYGEIKKLQACLFSPCSRG